MSNIFFSYSRKDSDCVYAIKDEMEAKDFPVWIDLESIEITSDWLDSIKGAINSADVFMLFWSPNASTSDYVTHEVKIAEKLHIKNEIKVLVVMLDGYDEAIPFDHIQGYKLPKGCAKTATKSFVSSLPIHWRRFSTDKVINQQHFEDVGDDYGAVLYETGANCRAYIVGKQDQALPKRPRDLVIALQFTRSVNDNMFGAILNSLPSDNTWILHITGPVDGDRYTLFDDQPEMWESARRFIVDMIELIGDKDVTTLHFFTSTPNALLGGVTMPLYRFWHVKLYNFVAGRYAPVVELTRS